MHDSVESGRGNLAMQHQIGPSIFASQTPGARYGIHGFVTATLPPQTSSHADARWRYPTFGTIMVAPVQATNHWEHQPVIEVAYAAPKWCCPSSQSVPSTIHSTKSHAGFPPLGAWATQRNRHLQVTLQPLKLSLTFSVLHLISTQQLLIPKLRNHTDCTHSLSCLFHSRASLITDLFCPAFLVLCPPSIDTILTARDHLPTERRSRTSRRFARCPR